MEITKNCLVCWSNYDPDNNNNVTVCKYHRGYVFEKKKDKYDWELIDYYNKDNLDQIEINSNEEQMSDSEMENYMISDNSDSSSAYKEKKKKKNKKKDDKDERYFYVYCPRVAFDKTSQGCHNHKHISDPEDFKEFRKKNEKDMKIKLKEMRNIAK